MVGSIHSILSGLQQDKSQKYGVHSTHPWTSRIRMYKHAYSPALRVVKQPIDQAIQEFLWLRLATPGEGQLMITKTLCPSRNPSPLNIGQLWCIEAWYAGVPWVFPLSSLVLSIICFELLKLFLTDFGTHRRGVVWCIEPTQSLPLSVQNRKLHVTTLTPPVGMY